MQKAGSLPRERGSSRAARIAAVAALLVAFVAVAAVLLRSDDSYQVTLRATDGGQLVKGDQVKLGAAPVGDIARIDLADDGTVLVRLDLHGPAAPLPEGTIARVRLDSLSGVANRYISLQLPLLPHGTIPEGGVLATTQTETAVDLDALFDALDPPTRRGLASLIKGGAEQYDGKAEAARKTLDRFGPALRESSSFFEQFTHDRPGFEALLGKGAIAMRALASRRSELTHLVSSAQIATQAIADENQPLADALGRLPDVLVRGRATLVTLRSTLDPLTQLVDASKPSAPQLPAYFGRLHRLVRTGADPLARLADLLAKPGTGNDLVDLLGEAPSLAALTNTAFPRAIRTMNASEDQLAAFRAYSPDFFGAIAHAGQITANYDANGHYARVQPDLLAFDFNSDSNTLEARTGTSALSQVETGRGSRCPGGVVQPGGGAPRPFRNCLSTAFPASR